MEIIDHMVSGIQRFYDVLGMTLQSWWDAYIGLFGFHRPTGQSGYQPTRISLSQNPPQSRSGVFPFPSDDGRVTMEEAAKALATPGWRCFVCGIVFPYNDRGTVEHDVFDCREGYSFTQINDEGMMFPLPEGE